LTNFTIDKIVCGNFHSAAGTVEEILKLMQLVHPSVPRSMDLLRWQYFTEDIPSCIYTARTQQRIVAIYCAVSACMTIAGEKKTAGMVQDVMTHPDFRGRGLLHALARQYFDGLIDSGEIGYSFPNQLSQGSFLRTGWSRLCKVPDRVKAI